MYFPLEQKVNQLIKLAEEELMIVGLFCATRTFKEQEELWQKGRNMWGDIINKSAIITWARPGFSAHNYGLAADVVFKVNDQWSWDFRLPWERLGEIGEELGLTWGGRWKMKDLVHFQMTNDMPIQTAYDIYQKTRRVEDVWTAMENYKGDMG